MQMNTIKNSYIHRGPWFHLV